MQQRPNLIILNICTIYPHKPKNSNLTNSLLTHYPLSNQIQKDPKDSNLKSIFTKKLVYTWFFPRLPCRWFVSVILFQLLKIKWPSIWCNFLKSPKNQYGSQTTWPTYPEQWINCARNPMSILVGWQLSLAMLKAVTASHSLHAGVAM